MPRWENLWVNANLATMATPIPSLGLIQNAAIAVNSGRIAWIGSMDDLPTPHSHLAHTFTDVKKHWITPGLIDCHTHLIFGGQRSNEYQRRLQGESYESIARAGGGIVSTVAATRTTTASVLQGAASSRLARLHSEGITTVEIKSGYGLDTMTELKMLQVGRKLESDFPGTIQLTFLGAHAVPREFIARPDDYIDIICKEMLPQVVDLELADAVDAFCEGIAFTPSQVERVFETAQKSGLPIKLHADQLSDLVGAALAARFGALSADHLEHAAEEGIAAMATSGTTAVLLPGAWYFTHATKLPPIESFRAHGVPMAIATDCNPGSSPATSLLLMLNMACTLFRFTIEEALLGVTRHAAGALGLSKQIGMLEVGHRADLAIWDIQEPAELCYWMGANPCVEVICAGQAMRNHRF